MPALAVEPDVERLTVRSATAFSHAFATCRAIRDSGARSAVSIALARSLQHHVLVPYQRECASVEASPARLTDTRSKVTAVVWASITPTIRALSTALEIYSADAGAARVKGSDSLAPSTKLLSTAAHVLESVHSLEQPSTVFTITRHIWVDVFSVFAKHMILWLSEGEVYDATSDFFVERRHATDIGQPNRDRDVEYVIVWNRVPTFLSPKEANDLLFAGNAVNWMLHENRISTVADQISNPRRLQNIQKSVENIAMRSHSTSLALEASCEQWVRNTLSLLSQHLTTAEVSSTLRTLRGHFLLGYELFWRIFTKKLAPNRHLLSSDMSTVQRERAELFLVGVVESCLSEVQIADSEAGTLRFSVSECGDIAPYILLPFPANAVLKDTEVQYAELFSVAFKIRSVLHELYACHCTIMTSFRGSTSRNAGNREQSVYLKKCIFLHIRMFRFVQALDDYLQVDIFEGSLRVLMHGLDANRSNTDRVEFHEFLSEHKKTLDAICSQSMIAISSIWPRIEAILECCRHLCTEVNRITSTDKVDYILGRSMETSFMRNAKLFLSVLSSVHSKTGGVQKSALFARLDYNGFYRLSGGGLRAQSEIF